MERRNRSLKALQELQYTDSLDAELKASRLEAWAQKYIPGASVENFDLTKEEMTTLSELFYKNINFLKSHKDTIKIELDSNQKIKQFLNH